MDAFKTSTDVFFVLMGAIMVLAMHSGFAFLELGTVRKKSQVNALVKILVDFSMSTIAYFFIGYSVAYGVQFFSGAETLAAKNGYDLVKFFFLLTFAAAVPAIISGGIAAYKAAEITRLLVKEGALVRVLMTKNAQEFITPLTLQTLSGNPVALVPTAWSASAVSRAARFQPDSEALPP